MKKILVTNSAWLNAANKPNTIITGTPAQNIVDYIRKNPIYKERSMMEENANYRQIIPYVVVENNDGEFVMMQRTAGAGEERLRGHHYIGVGGHVDYANIPDGQCAIEHAAKREIQEELGFNAGELDFVGVILMSQSPVDRVHLGILYGYVTNEKQFNTNEMAVNLPTWVTADTIAKHYPNLEGWSKLVFDFLFD